MANIDLSKVVATEPPATWEYKVLDCDAKALESTLNQLGAEAWELVHLSVSGAYGNGFGYWNGMTTGGSLQASSYRAVLKRRAPKPEPPKSDVKVLSFRPEL